MSDRRRVGQTGRLDYHVVEPILAPEEIPDDADQVSPHGAADAAVVHLEDLFVCPDHQLIVDPDLSELVHDHGDPFAMLGRQNPIEQRGLACAQKPRQDRNGHQLLLDSRHNSSFEVSKPAHISSAGEDRAPFAGNTENGPTP